MVSLKERQTLAALLDTDPHLKKFQLLLAGENLAGDDCEEGWSGWPVRLLVSFI